MNIVNFPLRPCTFFPLFRCTVKICIKVFFFLNLACIICHILYSLVLRFSTLLHAPHNFNFEMWCKAPGTYSHRHQVLQLKWITIYICTCCVETFAKSCIPCTTPVVTLTIGPFQGCQAAQWQFHRGSKQRAI